MKTHFALLWQRGDRPHAAFKHKALGLQFTEYTDRINKFSPCRISGSLTQSIRSGRGGQSSGRTALWLCERAQLKTQMLSSEALAQRLRKVQEQGMGELVIAVGGPNGLPAQEIENLEPDLLWSFGPLTLPHELAAVVASEQIYRAWTILKGFPYHGGH